MPVSGVLRRHDPTCVGRRTDAVASGSPADLFSGQICLHKETDGRSWHFRFAFREGERPLVGIFFNDQTVSGRFDMNALRHQHRLTRRETDVVRHLLDGAKNHEIAEELSIAEQTVKDDLSSIHQKLGVPNRFELLRFLVCLSQQLPATPCPGRVGGLPFDGYSPVKAGTITLTTAGAR